MAELKTTGWVKYAVTDIAASQGAPTQTATTTPTNTFDCHGFRGARIRFYCDTNDLTITPHIYLVFKATDAGPTAPQTGTIVQFDTDLLADIAECTAGTAVGVAGGNATASDNYFGTVGAATTSAWGTKLLAHHNAILQVFSSDNSKGEVLISDLGNAAGIHIRFELGTANTANAEILLDV